MCNNLNKLIVLNDKLLLMLNLDVDFNIFVFMVFLWDRKKDFRNKGEDEFYRFLV